MGGRGIKMSKCMNLKLCKARKNKRADSNEVIQST